MATAAYPLTGELRRRVAEDDWNVLGDTDTDTDIGAAGG